MIIAATTRLSALMLVPLAGLLAEEAPAAAESAERLASWGDRIGFALVGSLIVIGTLAALWGLSAMVGSVFKHLDRRANARAVAKEVRERAETSGAGFPGPDAEPPVAAIAAAIAVILDRPHRIVAIRPRTSHAWTQVGRHEHFESHRLR